MAQALRLTVGVISVQETLLADFLRHHAPLLQNEAVQTVLFIDSAMYAGIAALVGQLQVRAQILYDDAIVPVSPKRNAILDRACASHIAYLDDDSWIQEPERFLERLSPHLIRDDAWLLFTACYRYGDGRKVMAYPRYMGLAATGTLMEWNQVYPVAAVRRAGGWQEEFGAGSGYAAEGFLLFHQLTRQRLFKQSVADVIVEHPGLDPGESDAGDRKLRHIRRSQPALLVWLWRHKLITAGAALLWAIRFSVIPFAAGVVQWLCGRRRQARVWMLAPWDFFAGVPAAWRDPRLRRPIVPRKGTSGHE